MSLTEAQKRKARNYKTNFAEAITPNDRSDLDVTGSKLFVGTGGDLKVDTIGLLLSGRLRAWQALGDAPAPARLPRFALVYAGLILLILVAIMGLMGAKPV